MEKPLVFVGSSSEGLRVAQTVEELLAEDARVQLWTSGVFGLGNTTLESLLLQLEKTDFAVFILTPDDRTTSRGKGYVSPRDNVIFESGLFMGKLGKGRTFLVYDKEHDTKLPSDFAGLTLAPYSHKRFLENPLAGLGPAASQIRRALAGYSRSEEMDLIKAFVRFIRPDTELTSTYSDILTQRLLDIRAEVARLESQGDWSTLLKVRQRLREYFEYSGNYLLGVAFGRLFVRALQESGDYTEAAWATVKNVGYLLILAAKHAEGRKEIANVLDSIPSLSSSSSLPVLKFYCSRYLGISYQNDDIAPDLGRAKACFDQAGACLEAMDQTSHIWKELHARLLGNYGNLAFDSKDLHTALNLYQASRQEFLDVDDAEHIGIASLKIGKCILAGAGQPEDSVSHLENAESIFINLGWVEGQGRVHEQYALLNSYLAARQSDTHARHRYLHLAVAHAKRSKVLFVRVANQKGIGSVESLLDRLQSMLSP